MDIYTRDGIMEKTGYGSTNSPNRILNKWQQPLRGFPYLLFGYFWFLFVKSQHAFLFEIINKEENNVYVF